MSKEDDMHRLLASLVACGLVIGPAVVAQTPKDLDARVTKFLDDHRGDWHDLNVPESDGQLLHDLVLKGRYTRALELGTSTGRSGIWTAWALAKTGGRLVTIEIDPGRHDQAVRNFRDAGLAAFIDARLADAHDLVPKLEGPFDFVFIDADKDWYTAYAKAVIPKLVVGGCLTAHNVYLRRGGGYRGGNMTGDFYDYVSSLPFMETTVTPGGVAISYKRRER
jgi:predicted O-methyltransferase YrrM